MSTTRRSEAKLDGHVFPASSCFSPRSTKATHWPWLLNVLPNCFQPPSLHWSFAAGADAPPPKGHDPAGIS